MSKEKWSEKKALESWKAFWSTIARTERLIDPRKPQPKSLRTTFNTSLDAPVVYDTQALTAVVDLLMASPRIADNYAHKTVGKQVAETTIQEWTPTACFSEKTARALISEFRNGKPEEMIVYMPVYGISIPSGQRLSVGPYTFLARDSLDSLGRKGPHSGMPSFINNTIRKGQPFVSVSVSACDHNKAREKAITEFQWLENAIRLFVDSKNHDFGITSSDPLHIENAIVARPDGQLNGASSQLKGVRHLIPIMELFEADSFLHKLVATLGIASSNLSKYQKRIKHAVYLGGLAVHESVASVSFFLGISALEHLFQVDTDKYMSPSIAQQIVESFCFLMVDDEHRRATFEEMRPFYQKRSAIVHGGLTEVTDQDVWLVRQYLRHAIVSLLTDPKLSKIKKNQDLSEMVKDIKFGKK